MRGAQIVEAEGAGWLRLHRGGGWFGGCCIGCPVVRAGVDDGSAARGWSGLPKRRDAVGDPEPQLGGVAHTAGALLAHTRGAADSGPTIGAVRARPGSG